MKGCLCYDISLTGGTDMAVLAGLVQYLAVFIILAALAVAGVFLGKYLRNKKDAEK